MKEELQKKLVDGIIGIFKDASEKVAKGETKDGDTVDKDKKVEKDLDTKDKDVKDVPAQTGITPEQMLEGLSKMGENIVKGVLEAVKTPEQRSQENKVVAVDAVKQYLVQEGFDLKDQSIDITFAETKKGGGIQDGGSLELKLVKNGTELNPNSNDTEDGENQFKTIKDIPEDVAKEANREIWKELLK